MLDFGTFMLVSLPNPEPPGHRVRPNSALTH